MKPIPISTAAQKAGVPLRTLNYHAKVGNLKTIPLPNGHRLTTMKDVQDWQKNPAFHKPPRNK